MINYVTIQQNSSEHRVEDRSYIPSEINIADILLCSISFHRTAAYIKVVHQNSTPCRLLIDKSKLTLMKNKLVTIPWLELQAALITSRIKVTILDQMDMVIHSAFL